MVEMDGTSEAMNMTVNSESNDYSTMAGIGEVGLP